MVSAAQEKPVADLSLARILAVSVCVSLALAGFAGYWFSLRVAFSVLVGGAVSSVSFFLLKRDMLALMQGPVAALKARFFIRYYLRLALVVLVLFLLLKSQVVHVLALLVGLSTVLIGIGITVVGTARQIFRFQGGKRS